MAELGAVASIIQIADLGFRLSIKLFAFAETVASADKEIKFTSKDVSLTSSVLKEVGEILRKDQESHLYSPRAIQTATDIVSECQEVFLEIEEILIDTEPASTSAGQIALIRDLIESKEKQVQQFEQLKRSLSNSSSGTESSGNFMQSPAISSAYETPPEHLNQASETKLGFVNQLMHLFDRLFGEVDTPAYQIGILSRYRIKSQIYTAKSNEIQQMSKLHGEAAIHKVLLDSNEHVQRTDREEGQRQQRIADLDKPSPHTRNSTSGRDEHPSSSATTRLHNEESPPELEAGTASYASSPPQYPHFSTSSYSASFSTSRVPSSAHQDASDTSSYSARPELDAPQGGFSSIHYSGTYTGRMEELDTAMQGNRSSSLFPIIYRPRQTISLLPEDATQKELDDLLDLWTPQEMVDWN